jgi:uncharacterized membrane protein YcaP (DUF421 family)
MEIVIRTIVIYAFLWALTRAMGKRELAQLSAFELLLLVTIGDLVQQGVTEEDFSLTGAILSVGTIGLLVIITSYVGFRWPRARPVVDGLPVIILRDGQPLHQALKIERLRTEDLVEAARQQGIGDLAQVKIAVLEPDGKFSFIQFGGAQTEAQQESGQQKPAL